MTMMTTVQFVCYSSIRVRVRRWVDDSKTRTLLTAFSTDLPQDSFGFPTARPSERRPNDNTLLPSQISYLSSANTHIPCEHRATQESTTNRPTRRATHVRQVQLGEHPVRAAWHHLPARSAHYGLAAGHHGRDLECARQDHVSGGHQLVRLQGHRTHRRGQDAQAGTREPRSAGLEPIPGRGGRAGRGRGANKEAVRAEYLPIHITERGGGQREGDRYMLVWVCTESVKRVQQTSERFIFGRSKIEVQRERT